jgi:hypothetical protein
MHVRPLPHLTLHSAHSLHWSDSVVFHVRGSRFPGHVMHGMAVVALVHLKPGLDCCFPVFLSWGWVRLIRVGHVSVFRLQYDKAFTVPSSRSIKTGGSWMACLRTRLLRPVVFGAGADIALLGPLLIGVSSRPVVDPMG